MTDFSHSHLTAFSPEIAPGCVNVSLSTWVVVQGDNAQGDAWCLSRYAGVKEEGRQGLERWSKMFKMLEKK